MDQLIQDGTLIASDEVRMELREKQDDLFGWVEQRRQMFIPPTPRIQAEVRRILTPPCSGLLDPNSPRPEADAFAIALVIVKNCKVVTQERKRKKLTKIPSVCDHFGID
jgi:hypothetical protein